MRLIKTADTCSFQVLLVPSQLPVSKQDLCLTQAHECICVSPRWDKEFEGNCGGARESRELALWQNETTRSRQVGINAPRPCQGYSDRESVSEEPAT
jgi:hypothetical protein